RRVAGHREALEDRVPIAASRVIAREKPLDGLASSCVVDPAQPPVLLERAVVDLGMPFGDAAEMTDQVPHLVRIGGDSNFLANARHLLCLRFGRVWLTYPARRAGKTATAGETTAAPSWPGGHPHPPGLLAALRLWHDLHFEFGA